MGSLNLNNLKNDNKISPDFTYVDIHLDIDEGVVLTGVPGLSPRSKDMKVEFDESAIKNSIFNILNTKPGERFLIPEFGTNLLGYLFQPVSEPVANAIGRTILSSIERWEPRVVVEHVTVVGVPFGTVTTKNTGRFNGQVALSQPTSEHQYDVTVIVSIPTLKVKADIEGTLTTSGFAEVRNVNV